EVEEALDWA
ncbi:unnamed protein product, partial [Allacma fusca]